MKKKQKIYKERIECFSIYVVILVFIFLVISIAEINICNNYTKKSFSLNKVKENV